MDKRTATVIVIIFAVFIWAGLAAGRSGRQSREKANLPVAQDGAGTDFQTDQMLPDDIVQVYLFHPTHRCTTCVTIGEYARQTVVENYQEELASGNIEFKEINLELPENQALAEKFQASGSALFINARRGGNDSIAEDVQVWRLANDEAAFKEYLKRKLDNLLGK